MSTTNQVFAITGANRGLGLNLTKRLLERSNTTVIASVRNSDASKMLESEINSLSMGENSSLKIIELDFSSAFSVENICQTVKEGTNGLTHVDVLICNAGCATPLTPVLDTSAENLRTSFEVNTIAPLLVFQAFWPLLKKSSTPKYALISSSVGSIAVQEPVPGGGYGPSKAASNWLTKAIHAQHEKDGLTAFSIQPGWVHTDMGAFAAKEWKYDEPLPVTLEDSVRGMLRVIDGATRETTSGKFITYDGELLQW